MADAPDNAEILRQAQEAQRKAEEAQAAADKANAEAREPREHRAAQKKLLPTQRRTERQPQPQKDKPKRTERLQRKLLLQKLQQRQNQEGQGKCVG
jgi:hypothetical protein